MTHERETYTVATETIHLVNKSLSNWVQATANALYCILVSECRKSQQELTEERKE